MLTIFLCETRSSLDLYLQQCLKWKQHNSLLLTVIKFTGKPLIEITNYNLISICTFQSFVQRKFTTFWVIKFSISFCCIEAFLRMYLF